MLAKSYILTERTGPFSTRKVYKQTIGFISGKQEYYCHIALTQEKASEILLRKTEINLHDMRKNLVTLYLNNGPNYFSIV
jgi:hypothetical protein